MQKLSLLAAAAALALSAAGSAHATKATPGAVHVGNGVKVQPFVSKGAMAVLYDQTANDSGSGIVSQNFEATYDAYDAQAADDFVVPAGASWRIKEVDVGGAYFNGSGPAVSENVTFYKDKKGKPGAVVAEFMEVSGVDNGSGSLKIKLPKTVRLDAGKYWVSVQANMDFSSGGEWAWENQSTVEGKAAMWQNPGDGFGSGCVKYANEDSCVNAGLGDHLFMLKGKSK